MCGIAGFFNVNGEPASAVVLKRMTDAVAHRGPDGEGFATDSFVALGHRRLAIIDLSPAGHQPMQTANGKYVLTYNGEVYNFQELRLELEAKGHQFRSRTDSEVVLHAYAEWGEVCVNRFNGMFAFGIWDKAKQRLFLARDRYGIKPLYYAMSGSTFLFGSEAKAILAHGGLKASMDREGLVEYLTFQNFLTDRTLFGGIRVLPAGCTLTVGLGGGALPAPKRYWDFSFQEPAEARSLESYTEELDHLIKQAVQRQLVSDVDVGAYLSGGMDSGTITAIAATQLPYLKTFTCGFDLNSASGIELGFDERAKAELMSYKFKTEHYEMVLKAGDMERVMSKLAWHIEEPRVGQSYPNFYVAQLASKFVKVVLSGTGGDELFGGYPWRYYRAARAGSFAQYVDEYFAYWQRLVPAEQLPKVLGPIWGDVKHVSTHDIFRNVYATHASELRGAADTVNHSLYFEAKTFLHGLLTIDDKLAMAHSLETRVPFLDNDLVEFAMRLPVHMKLAHIDAQNRLNENEFTSKALQRTNDGKVALRKSMEHFVPREIAQGQKQGFSAPDASWFKGESIDYVRRELLTPRARIWEFLDRAAVTTMVDEHLAGKENRRLLIWSLLNLEWWCRRFLN